METAANARAQKLDKFHPMDLYLYFHFGPASVGGSGSPYFLETVEGIQKAVKEADISNRSELRKKNEEDLDQEAKTKKRKHGKPLLVNSVEEMDEITASSSSSFGAEYQKQLQLETIRVETERTRVETERSRERRESLQFQIKMLEDLIAGAVSAEDKNELTKELDTLRRTFLQHAKLAAMVSSSTSDDASSQSVPSTSSQSST